MMPIQIFRFPGISLIIELEFHLVVGKWAILNPDGGQSGNPGRALPQLWQGSGGGQSSEDQIEDPVDDDGASLSIVGARGPINSHWVTPICTNSHTQTTFKIIFFFAQKMDEKK